MSEKAGDEVEQLLQSWGLADLNAKFKSNYIVIQAFEYLTEEDIIELIPKIGQRAIFRGRLQQWRQQNNIAGFNQSPQTPKISVKLTETKDPQVSLKPAPPTQSSPQPVQNDPQSLLKIVKQEPIDNETKIQSQPNSPPKTLPQTPTCPTKSCPQTPNCPPRALPPPVTPPLFGHIMKPIKQILPKPLNKPQIKVLATRSEIQTQMKVLSAKNQAKQIQPSLAPPIPQSKQPTNDLKIQHKVYGTLTMCNQNVKQLISPKTTAIQSKVQQFYISPVVDAPSSPPPAIQPFVQIHTQPTMKSDHPPFVTSIIRVETSNCEKGTISNEPLNNQQKKVNRTTILQKLTSPLPGNAHQQTSPKVPNAQPNNSPQSQRSTGQPTSLKMENYEDLEHSPVYPIVKMETNSSDSTWEEYTEPQIELDPEPLPQPEPVADRNPDHTADEVMAEFTDDKDDTDSAHEMDSENDNSNSLLKRMPQKVATRSKGKPKVVNNPRKLEIPMLPTSRRKKSYKPRFDPFVLTNEEFIEKYRFDKDTATFIIELINTDDDDQPSKRGMPLSGSLQVLTALRFFGKNVLQCDLGELHGISQPTVSRVILRIAKKLALQHPNFITFPSSSRQIQKAKNDFLLIAGFPDVIGTIDCMHLEVKCPRKNVVGVMADHLPNMKGYYPLNVQDIRNILMSSANGRHVLNFYETHERLDVTRRRMLVESIVQECWDTNRRITLSDCIELAEEIIEILPNENKENYYSAKKGKAPRSPIYNKYRRLHNRHFLENRTPVISSRRKKPRLSLLEMDDDVDADDSIIIS